MRRPPSWQGRLIHLQILSFSPSFPLCFLACYGQNSPRFEARKPAIQALQRIPSPADTIDISGKSVTLQLPYGSTRAFWLLRPQISGSFVAMEPVENSPPDSTGLGTEKPKYRPQPGDERYGKSRITNGSALLPGIDGRNAWVRRAKDVIAAHLSDLAGEDNTSVAERSIIRRAAVLTVQLEQLEAKFALANGEASANELDLYARTSSTLRRLLEAVGLQRRARTVGPSLGDLLRADLNQQRERERCRHERLPQIDA